MRKAARGVDVPVVRAWDDGPAADLFAGRPSPHVVELPTVPDPRGDLTFVEGLSHVPFEIRRLYYFSGMRPGDARGSLAHLHSDLCLIAVSGRVRVRLDDGTRSISIVLERPTQGLVVPHMTWLEMDHFSPETICLVLSSDRYDQTDYVRDYEEFLRLVGAA